MQRCATVRMLLRQDLGPPRSEFDADFSFSDDSVGSELVCGSDMVWRGRLLSINY